MRVAIITGASSGLGSEYAKRIDRKIEHIDELWLVARRTERLEELAKQLNKPCKILTSDMTEHSDLEKISELLKTNNANVRMLINCAGYGKIGDFEQISLADNIGMVDVNCCSLTEITYRVLPFMKKNAIIINIASSAAFMPQSGFAVYAATKSYVLSFTRALRREVSKKGLRVIAVCPGPVKTEFFEIAEKNSAVMWYKKFFMAEAPDVVSKTFKDILANKEISIYGLSMKMFYVIAKVIPHRVILKFMTTINHLKN